MAFEGSDCMVPHLRWLGLRNTQVYMKHTQGPICTIPTQCLDRLSPVDYRKIKTLKDSIRQRMQLQSVSGSGTSSEEFHPYIQELDLMLELSQVYLLQKLQSFQSFQRPSLLVRFFS